MAIDGLKQLDDLPQEYAAAIRERAGGGALTERWRLTRDNTKIANAEDEDVIFACGAMELYAQLQKANPAPVGFTYVGEVYSNRQHFDDYVEVYIHLRSAGAQPAQIFEQARTRGSVLTTAKEIELSHVAEGYDYDIVDDEFVYHGLTGLLYWDPKKVKRLRAARKAYQTRKKEYGVLKLDILCDMAQTIVEFIGTQFPNLIRGTSRGYWGNYRYNSSGVLLYEQVTKRSGRKYVSDHLADCIELAQQLKVISALRKHNDYRTWLMDVRPYIAGMRRNKVMNRLADTLTEECKKAKLTIPA